MTNNDYLRSIRYLIKVNEAKLSEIIKLSSAANIVSVDQLKAYLKGEDEEGYLRCDDEVMAHFLDGLVYHMRGKDQSRPPLPFEFPITNNLVLKKLRVAFALKEDEMHEVLKLANVTIGRAELSALLRKKGHVNYRDCGDQVLRNFINGLTIKIRG